MHKLPETPFEIGRYKKVKADNYGKVRFDNKQYSTSSLFAGKQLWVKATAQEMIVMDEDWHEVIRHQRLYLFSPLIELDKTFEHARITIRG